MIKYQNRRFCSRLRSYHPGNTTSRPISAVKQDRALSSTVVGDHTETKGDVIFCKKFPRVSYTELKYDVFQCFPNQQLLEYATESLCRNTRIWNTRVFLRPAA